MQEKWSCQIYKNALGNTQLEKKQEVAMRIRKKLLCSFLIITLLPCTLLFGTCKMIYQFQMQFVMELDSDMISVTKVVSNPIQFMTNMTQEVFETVREMSEDHAEQLLDGDILWQYNNELSKRFSFLLVKKGDVYAYVGNEQEFQQIVSRIPNSNQMKSMSEDGVYVGGENSFLIKAHEFRFSDGTSGVVYVVTMVSGWMPAIKAIFAQFVISFLLIILFTAAILILWIYRGIVRPLQVLRKATHRMQEGDWDFSIQTKSKDEIGMLCQDFEEMRIHLKESNEMRLKYEEEMRELVSNISHDLKTPLTAIEGYSEGLLDGVAKSLEKQEKYIRIIHTKAREMARLVDELSESSKIENGIVPYNFQHVNVGKYFDDCVEDLKIDLNVQGIKLNYENEVPAEVRVEMDPEQIRRVINNVVGNSVKYFQKDNSSIGIRLQDEELMPKNIDYEQEEKEEKSKQKTFTKDGKDQESHVVSQMIRVEIWDNGQGISEESLPHIFDRFYRADESRHSSTGGSGLGLAIARKIINDHGGRIWATSKEGEGTHIFFTLCKEKKEMEQVHVSGLLGGRRFF